MNRSTLSVIPLCCIQSIALAQPDLSPLQRPSRPMIEAAQQHYLSGTRFFEAGSWDAALVEFSAGFQLSGERDFLHNLSWTHEKAGRLREALDYAERYLMACRGTEDEERAAKRVAFLKQRYPGGSAAPSEPAAASSTPVVSPAAVPAPASVPASAPSPAPAQFKTEARTKTPPLALGLVAGGGALAAVGIGCLAGAWATGQQLGSADLAYSDAASLLDRGRALNTTGIALSVVGGAALVGGAITWAVLGRRTDKPVSVTWLPYK